MSVTQYPAGKTATCSSCLAERVSVNLPCRPPSCPLVDGPLASWTPGTSAGRMPYKSSFHVATPRPTSASALSTTVQPSLGGFSSVVANPVFSPQSPAQSPAPDASPAGESACDNHHNQRRPSTACALPPLDSATQVQEHRHWHVDVVLASHDAELASVKDAVLRLDFAQRTAATYAEETSLHLASLDHRLQVLEHGIYSTSSASPVGHLDRDEHQEDNKPSLEASLSKGIGCHQRNPEVQCEVAAPGVHAQDSGSGSVHAKESCAAGAQDDMHAHDINQHPAEAHNDDNRPQAGAARQMEAALSDHDQQVSNLCHQLVVSASTRFLATAGCVLP